MAVESLSQWGCGALLVALRLAPLVICLPASLFQGLPRGSRLVLVLLIAIGLSPTLCEQRSMPVTYDGLLVAGPRELLLGISLSVGFVLLFAGMTLAGQILSPLTGITWADAADPLGSGDSGAAIERFFGLWAVVLFWATNGHRHVMAAILESFDRAPLGCNWGGAALPRHVAALLMHGSQLGIRVAAPVAFCLVGATLAVALLGRSLSFWGATGMGTAVSWMVLLVMTCVLLPSLSDVYQQQLASGLELMEGWITPVQAAGEFADVGR